MMRPVYAASLALAVTLAAASPGLADRGPVNVAKEHFDRGQSLYLRGMYDEAALEFLSAYEAKPFAAFLFNAAVCYEKTRLYQRAVELFRRYLDYSPTAEDRTAVRVRIAQLVKLVPAAPPRAPASTPTTQLAAASQPARPPTPASAPPPSLPPLETKGLVVVESTPPGAFVYLNDKLKGPIGRTPWEATLAPGDYKLLVESKGYKPVTQVIRPGVDRLLVLIFALSEEHYLGWLEVEANVPAADVYLDRREAGPVGRTPYSGFLKPGKHTVLIEREGYVPERRTIEIARGKAHEVAVKLGLVPHGWVAVNVNDSARGAHVLVDGQQVCDAPCRVPVQPGEHRVSIEQRGFKRYRGTVTVSRAVETRLGASMSRAPSRVSAYVSFVFSAALLATGTYFGLKSRSEHSLLEQQLGSGTLIASDDPRLTDGWTHAIAADALFALGGVTALFGLYYALRSPGPDTTVKRATKDFAVVPIAGPGGVGVQGRF